MFNRSYNHKDVLTRASITIQILEDVALYKAQLFSSNGNIFSSSDESSELYVRVYKGLDDITSKFTDIVWKRFTSSSNNVEEDLTWGDKYAGKTDITITKDDVKQKANIQVEIYSLINGERTLVAADFITFININDMQGSDLPPENPKHGDLWLDTSVTPPRLMMWDSNLGMWVEVAIAGRDRRNLIRHSNFYRKNFDYWNNVNNSILEIESMSGKKWAHIKSNIAQNDYCGISQTVSANAKGQYSFQMLSEIYIQSAYPNGDALVAFYSINSLGTKTLIKEETFDLKTDEKVFTSTFTTLEDTKQIEVIISGQKNTNFDFVVTNIKLENYPIPTEWELAIEDMQDALDQKVGNTPEEVFDSLTDGGKMQGIYVDIDEHGQKNYYVSGRYIDAYNLVVRRKKDNIETLKVDEEGNVSLRVNNLQIISDTGECVNTATENDIDTIDNKVQTVKDTVAQINLDMNGITQRVEATETTTTNLNNKIDNIQVGGRNLILDSKLILLNGSDHGNSNKSTIVNDSVKIMPINNGNVYNTGIRTSQSRIQGELYTISFEVLTPDTIGFYWYPSEKYVKSSYIKGSSNWQKVNFTYTQTGSSNNNSTLFGFLNLIAGHIYYYKNLKLEKGNKATDWTPAPEDVDSAIDSVDSKATTISNKVSEITTNLNSITQRVSSTETTTTSLTTQMNAVDGKINTAKNEAITGARQIPDTRSRNENPLWYIQNYPRQTITEFKYANVIGIGSSAIYGTLETKVPWANNTGGYPVQTFRSNSTATYERKGESDTAWGAWKQIEDTSGAQAKANQALGDAKSYTNEEITKTNNKVSSIETNLNGITSRVGTVETKTTNLEKITEKKLINNFSNSNTLDLWSAPGTTLKYSSIVGYYMDCLSNNLNHMIQSEYFEIDSSKSYKISLMQQFAPNSGTATFYFGIYAYDKDKNNIGVYIDKGTSLQTNPYFMNRRTPASDYGNWRTWSGYIYSHDTIIQDYTPKGNVTSCMKFSPKTKFLRIRFLHYRNGSYGDSGQGSMYFAQPAIYEIDNQIVNTEQRLRTAEQKITDEAITNTVKQNFYTKGDVDSKGYQTESQVQQTVNQLQMKFTESGGYNLLRNGGAKNGITFWKSITSNNFKTISDTTSQNTTSSGTVFAVGCNTTTEKTAASYRFLVKPNTKYTISFSYYIGYNSTGLDVWWLESDAIAEKDNLNNTSYTTARNLLAESSYLSGKYRKRTITITTSTNAKSCYIRLDNNGTKDNNTSYTYFTDIMVSEGELALPWSPHPSEIYDGITTIDKDGITVTSSNVKSKTSMTASGFKITKTDTNEDVFKVNADGTLVMKGSITVTGGSVPTSNLTGTITANMISANAITTDKIATNAITADKINAGTITADKLKIQARDSFSVNPNFSLWSSTYPYGMSSWSSSTCTKVAVDNRNVLQYAVTNASTQMGAVLNISYFNAGLNLDGMQYIGLEVKYRLTSGTNPAGACMLLDIYYTDNTYERLNLSLKSINSSVTTNTWYTAKKVFKVSNITKTFKRVSGYLLANWSSETNTVKTIQFASANAYACTEQDYLTQTWSSGTEINGAKIKTGTLSADKITTGTLDASKVNVTKLNASNITSGTIDASKITVTNLNANNITAGTIGGGYNLLKNGNAQGGLKYWVSNGGGISVVNSSKGSAFRTTLPSGIRHDDVQLKPNTDYVYSAYLHCSTAITGSSTTPLHFWCNATKGSAGIPACSIIKYSQKVPANTWTKVYVHIRTGNQDCWFRPFIYTGSGTGDITVRELGLYESSLNLPYSPHPSEIYDGITKIDKDGITVTSSNVNSKTSMTASGFKITKTDTNEDIFKVNSSGNLELYGIIRSRKDGQTRAEFKGDGIDFYSGSKLIGTISHDSTGAGTVSEARDRLWLRTEAYALKLQAVRADCSLGANNLYLQANNINLTPGKNTDNKVFIDGNLQVSGSLIATNVVAVFG